ncbi:EF-hand domain-containing protein [Microvirga rosea]|uniref:EF-hand domain-containing protein n=1 Tax=Microvirga rosea TaxID=2715425 RepID=UPI001D0BA0F6|nr:EF-hand domain-containing protein [Microvirga rosea]MCB8823333.1 EF-hand domain-containing protein [Microvirga rosea]
MARFKGIIASSLTLVAIGLAPTPALAAVPAGEIDRATRAVFGLIDRNGNGRIEAIELNRYVANVFAAMDTDRDGRLTREEFDTLSLGLLPLARRYDRIVQYSAARERIWTRWRNRGSATMSRAKFRLGAKNELSKAGARGQFMALTFNEFKQARFVRELTASLR